MKKFIIAFFLIQLATALHCSQDLGQSRSPLQDNLKIESGTSTPRTVVVSPPQTRPNSPADNPHAQVPMQVFEQLQQNRTITNQEAAHQRELKQLKGQIFQSDTRFLAVASTLGITSFILIITSAHAYDTRQHELSLINIVLPACNFMLCIGGCIHRCCNDEQD